VKIHTFSVLRIIIFSKLIFLGVPQGDDTQYILPKEEGGRLIPKQGSDEMKVANRLISIIKNFVNTG